MGIRLKSISPMQVFLTFIVAIAAQNTPVPQYTCYTCTKANSLDKSEACFVNPDLVTPTPTKNNCKNGCFTKRREGTDEYGSITKYTIERGCIDNKIEGTGCYDGKTTGDLELIRKVNNVDMNA